MTEFQLPNGFEINVKEFQNELNFIKYLVSSGELYFVNRNFY
jgi:hypothetical protein